MDLTATSGSGDRYHKITYSAEALDRLKEA
jgi:hypothetical protein